MTKKALCIGINYPGTQAELRGCINDARCWGKLMTGLGYQVKYLLDDGATDAPTRDNILSAIDELVKDVKNDDYIVFTYAGHGSQMPDISGDEADHKDETICPCDFLSAGMIKDDTLRKRLLVPLAENTKFLGLMDCCHSGTSLDLEFKFNPTTHKSATSYTGGYYPKTQYAWSPYFGWYKYFKYLYIPQITKPAPPPQTKAYNIKCQNAVMFSGCGDTQTSADAFIDNKPVGAFSYCMYSILTEKSNDIKSNLEKVNKMLKKRGFSQRTEVSLSRANINTINLF